METREALTMALSTYEGAVLLVSHDRHLLRAVTDELWLVHEGRKEVFEGDLDDYAKIVLDHRRVTAAEARAEHQADKAARNEAQPVNNKEARRLAAQERARIAELRKARRISQAELADAVVVTRQTIISLENGRYNASLLLAHKIAKYFGSSIEEIFLFEEEET